MLDEQAETLILHEIGEHRRRPPSRPAWGEMLLALDDRRTELLLRAVRDHLADLGTTLPALLERDEAVSLHFWFAGYDGVRPPALPGLADAYRALGAMAWARRRWHAPALQASATSPGWPSRHWACGASTARARPADRRAAQGSGLLIVIAPRIWPRL